MLERRSLKQPLSFKFSSLQDTVHGLPVCFFYEGGSIRFRLAIPVFIVEFQNEMLWRRV